jgi:ADP-dependent NAD(P)H-hydrate dehydratase / NAD(P)H-hydrate epimerase
VLPIVTPTEMRALDAAADVSVDVLIDRAGGAIARAALRMLGGSYGRRVIVLAGSGKNGADGRVAAQRLRERGIKVSVIDAAACPPVLDDCDLVIDAAYGTGFHGQWAAPDVGDAQVLAVDLPSGVDGVTGAAGPGVLPADRTVSLAALKPGVVFSPGSELAGQLEVADIGLDCSRAHAFLVQQSDIANWIPIRAIDSHKWRSAVYVVAGSQTMLGAAHLAAAAAQRAGAGMVRLGTPGISHDPARPTEVVGVPLPVTGWASEVLGGMEKYHSLVIGPGLGRADTTAASVRDVVARSEVPVVVDGDGLFALAWSSHGAATVLKARREPTVLTPHDGEYALLLGERVGADRLVAARRLAAATGSIVLLKGPATVIAAPSGLAYVVTAGDERLATAGTGDVLAGIIGALLAQGVPAFESAAAGAWIHGQAARRGPARGLVASDLPALIPAAMEFLG